MKRRYFGQVVFPILFFSVVVLFFAEVPVIAQPADKTAMLVIDVQVGYFPLHRGSFMLKNIKKLVEKAKQANVPVIYIHNYDKDFVPLNSRKWELSPYIKPEGEYLHVNKEYSSAFRQTNLESILSVRKIKKLVITGLSTGGCVNATIQAALARKYKLVIVSDAHGSVSPDAESEIRRFNMQWERQGAILKTTTEIQF